MRRPSRSVIVLCVALIVLLALAWWFSQRQAAPQNHAPSAVPVRVIKVAQQDVPRFATAIGSVLSLQNVQIRPQVDGILTQVLVKEGQWVKQGDLLAVIDDRAIRASIDQARALLEQ
ncbi:biotin/lipoyl-binding protein, partial [Pseudomonas shirazensis]